MTLHRLLYRSHCAIDGTAEEVDREILAIVEASRAANERAGVSGALLAASGVFVQAIEGPLAAIEQTFERICGDMRHTHVQLIDFTTAEARTFGEWSMAAIAPEGELVRLCATLDAVRGARVDPASASATIQLMRSIVVAGSADNVGFRHPRSSSGRRPRSAG